MMEKILLVARYEFMFNAKRREFLYTAIGMPLFMVALFGIIFWVATTTVGVGELTGERVGYVDQLGILSDADALPEHYIAYTDSASARADLDEGALDAFFIVPPTYMLLGQLGFYSYGTPPQALLDEIEEVLQTQMIAGFDTVLDVEFLRDPVRMEVYLENSQRILSREAVLGVIITPAVFAFVFVLTLQLTSTFLMSGIVEEKTNRVIEVLITSINPSELLAGKLLGLGALGLLQMGIWVVMAVIAFALFGDTEVLGGFFVPTDLVVLGAVYFVLMYFLIGSLLAGIGAVSDSDQESRQIAGIVSLVIVLPFFFFATYLQDPDSTIPTLLTFIPFTSGLSVVMRASYGTIPPTELAISLGLLVLTTVFIVWASGRIFRWALLLYGKKPSVMMLWRVLSGRVDMGTMVNNGERGAPVQKVQKEQGV